MSIETLRPCPFCGSDDIDPEGWASIDRSGPACRSCDAAADSIERWNTRTALSPQEPPALAAPAGEGELLAALRWIDGYLHAMQGDNQEVMHVAMMRNHIRGCLSAAPAPPQDGAEPVLYREPEVTEDETVIDIYVYRADGQGLWGCHVHPDKVHITRTTKGGSTTVEEFNRTAPPLQAQDEDRHEREVLAVVDQRDAAEEALSQAFYIVTGRSPEWSNVFGHAEALEEIEDACTLLRKSITAPPLQAQETQTRGYEHPLGSQGGPAASEPAPPPGPGAHLTERGYDVVASAAQIGILQAALDEAEALLAEAAQLVSNLNSLVRLKFGNTDQGANAVQECAAAFLAKLEAR